MTTLNDAFAQLFAGPLSRIDRDTTTAAKYLADLASLLGANPQTWPEDCRVLTDEVRMRVLATHERLSNLCESLVLLVAMGTPAA